MHMKFYYVIKKENLRKWNEKKKEYLISIAIQEEWVSRDGDLIVVAYLDPVDYQENLRFIDAAIDQVNENGE